VTLNEFIDQVGASKLSRMLGTTEASVNTWRRLKSAPRPLVAYELIALSHGALDWGAIYEPFVRKHYKKRKIKTESGTQLEFSV
jgi:hypothetical protein